MNVIENGPFFVKLCVFQRFKFYVNVSHDTLVFVCSGLKKRAGSCI